MTLPRISCPYCGAAVIAISSLSKSLQTFECVRKECDAAFRVLRKPLPPGRAPA